MRIINSVPWTSQEIETYRLQIFLNLVQGMRLLLDCLKDMSDNPPLSRSLSASFPPSPPYFTPPQSIRHHHRSPSSVNAPTFFNRRQRSESFSSNASIMMTIHTGSLDGIPSQIPPL